jgi:hypothetical protein
MTREEICADDLTLMLTHLRRILRLGSEATVNDINEALQSLDISLGQQVALSAGAPSTDLIEDEVRRKMGIPLAAWKKYYSK